MTREEYIELLRTTKKNQCRRELVEGESCCALGLLGFAVGYDKADMTKDSESAARVWARISRELSEMGLSVVGIYQANDSGFSFKAIATLIERGYLSDIPEDINNLV
jgi:hypothetical protein